MSKCVLVFITFVLNSSYSQDTIIRQLDKKFRQVVLMSSASDSMIYNQKMNKGNWVKHGKQELYRRGILIEQTHYKYGKREGVHLKLRGNDTVFLSHYKGNRLNGICTGRFISVDAISFAKTDFFYNGKYRKGNRYGRWEYKSDSIRVVGSYIGRSYVVEQAKQDSILVFVYPSELPKFHFQNIQHLFDFFEKHGNTSIGANLNLRVGLWRYYINNQMICTEQYNKKGILINRKLISHFDEDDFFRLFFFLNNH